MHCRFLRHQKMQENSKKRQHKTRICKKSFIDLNKKRCDVTRDRHNDLIWFIIKSTVHAHAIIINKYTTHCEMFEIIIGTDVLVNKRFHLCGLGVLFGGSLPNFNFFNVNPQIFQINNYCHLHYKVYFGIKYYIKIIKYGHF